MEEEAQKSTVSARFANSNELLKIAINKYRKHAKIYLLILLFPTLVEVIFISLQQIFVNQGTSLPALVAIIIGEILLIIASMLGQLALLYAANDDMLTVEGAYIKAWKNFLPYLWVTLLTGIIISIGYVLLIVPGIIWMIYYSLVSYVFVNENLRGRAALNKSKEYVKGYWWALFIRYIYIFVILIILELLASGLLSIIDVIGLHGIKQLLEPFISFFTIPLDVLFSFAIYEQLKSFTSLPSKTVSKKDSAGAVVASLLGIIIIMVPTLLLAVYILLFRPFQMSGDSMTPTYTNNEYFLIDIAAAKSGDLKRGDVVVFVAPPDHEKDFIKRIVGLPGDTIMIKNGNVYINGKKLNESAYLGSNIKTDGGTFLQDGQTLTIPQGEYFVLGDNRESSADSRDWGFVDQKEMIGDAMFCYWNCPVKK